MQYQIPGYKNLELENLVLDYNGTIARDGQIPESVAVRLRELSEEFRIYILTADTYGNARKQCENLPVTVMTFPEGSAMEEKRRIVSELGASVCVCMGNGRNDEGMLAKAALSVAVLDVEGACGRLLAKADLCVRSIEEGLDLLRYPKRLIAGLRG